MKRWRLPENWFRDEKLIFEAAVAAAAVIAVLAVVFIYDIMRDSAHVYAYAAREIGNGNFADGWYERVPMLNILLSGGLAALGLEAFRATVVVSSLFYFLTLFPLRRFLEEFLSPSAAAWGCLLFATTPKVIRYSVIGLIDSSRYFFLIAALMYLFRLRARPSRSGGVLFGLSLAGLAVSRGEELFFAVGLLFALPVLTRLEPPYRPLHDGRRRLAVFGLALFVFAAGITPFCAVNAARCGVFITDLRIAEAAFPGRVQRPAGNPWRAVGDGAVSAVEKFFDPVTNVLRGGYELFWVFTVVGTVVLIRRRRWKWGHTLLWGIFLLHTVLYCKVGIAYRYNIYLVPLFMPFTVAGLSFCGEQLVRLKIPPRLVPVLRRLAPVVLVAVLVLQVDNGMKDVFSRDDRGKRIIAQSIRRWGELNMPGRRVRLAATGLVEAVYWSGAYSVFNYGAGYSDLRKFRDFDLLLIEETWLDQIAGRTDLRLVPTPEWESCFGRRPRFRLYRRVDAAGGEKRP